MQISIYVFEEFREGNANEHIPISDDEVMEYNKIVSLVSFDWALEIDNN